MLEDVEQCSKETVVRAVNGPPKSNLPGWCFDRIAPKQFGDQTSGEGRGPTGSIDH